jgi:hypothetical protein
LGVPVLGPGAAGTFDEVAVKDPSVVFFEGRWHVFYTARGRSEYSTGYISAETLEGLREAPRHELTQIRGRASRYACAPQVLLFDPQRRWYLICQTRDANYQPVFSTTASIGRPDSWTRPQPLLEKTDRAKWIDFWVICDETTAYLFYTSRHRDVVARTTPIERFPRDWGEAHTMLSGVHEAVHVYRARGRDEYHMLFELNRDGVRSFGLARASRLRGPWEKVTETYATVDQLRCKFGSRWTDVVSHGEMVRTGCDQRLEYDAANPVILIQGRRGTTNDGPYQDLSWQLGLIGRDVALSPGD